VLQGSGEPVQLPDEQDIELPALSSGHHLVESRPTILRSAYAAIHILTDDLPTTAFDKFAQLTQLHFGVLVTVGRADPCVKCYSCHGLPFLRGGTCTGLEADTPSPVPILVPAFRQ
jgi:hypothetical protein